MGRGRLGGGLGPDRGRRVGRPRGSLGAKK